MRNYKLDGRRGQAAALSMKGKSNTLTIVTCLEAFHRGIIHFIRLKKKSIGISLLVHNTSHHTNFLYTMYSVLSLFFMFSLLT